MKIIRIEILATHNISSYVHMLLLHTASITRGKFFSLAFVIMPLAHSNIILSLDNPGPTTITCVRGKSPATLFIISSKVLSVSLSMYNLRSKRKALAYLNKQEKDYSNTNPDLRK